MTFEPDNADLLERVRVTAGARQVKALITRPAAVRAAILKLYAGDGGAFADVLQAENRPSRPAPDPAKSNGSSADV